MPSTRAAASKRCRSAGAVSIAPSESRPRGSTTANSSPPSRATASLAAQPRGRRARDLAQQLVAGVVAERVVDLLEAVEVDQQHRDVLVGPAVVQSGGEVLGSAMRFGSPVSASCRAW